MKNNITIDNRQKRIIRELSEKGLSRSKRKELRMKLTELKREEYQG